MVNITLIELHADEGSFSANLPFGTGSDDETGDAEVDEDADIEDSDGRSTGLAVLGVFLFMIAAAAVVKYLSGGDEAPDVDIDTEEEPSVEVATDD
jgi:hypothetical protein